jgi:MYXO-CTERM domain-containing protein
MIYYVFDNNGLPADVGNIPTTFLTTQTPGTTLVSGQFSYSDFRYTAGVLMYDGTVVPEPGTAAMALAGLGALAFIRSRSKAR